MQRRYLAIFGLLTILAFVAPVYANGDGFAQWLDTTKREAIAQGISEKVAADALDGLEEDEQVIRLDSKQPENKITLRKYLANSIPHARIAKGRRMLSEHRELLDKIGAQYGVQPEYIVALWGIESDFGRNEGNFSVIQSLATMAYEGRRAEFFKRELFSALKILESEKMSSHALEGSWAGAMGECQFMPSTYANYAVDGDGDGKRDIWDNKADIFASIANYLSEIGWNRNLGWGKKVTEPQGFNRNEADITRGNSADYWRSRGLDVGPTDATLYAIYASTPDEGLYLVTDNYISLLQWNRSRYFATAVGTLADAIGE